MKKFILLTFGFLAFAFYEMSGGSDFEPLSVKMARIDAGAAIATQTAENEAPETETEIVAVVPALSAPKPAAIRAKPVDTTPPGFEDTVTRVSLNLTTLNRAAETSIEPAKIEAASAVPTNVGSVTSSATTPAIIPSLIVPDDPGIVETVAVEAPIIGEIRSVTGNRVNVRGGPGTSYGVVNKLVLGDNVEVLSDNGDGWVLMRPLAGGPEGWMADFLLSES